MLACWSLSEEQMEIIGGFFVLNSLSRLGEIILSDITPFFSAFIHYVSNPRDTVPPLFITPLLFLSAPLISVNLMNHQGKIFNGISSMSFTQQLK